MSQHFKVRWTIDINAENSVDAARKCLAIQRDPDSIATFFQIKNITEGSDLEDIDLEDHDES